MYSRIADRCTARYRLVKQFSSPGLTTLYLARDSINVWSHGRSLPTLLLQRRKERVIKTATRPCNEPRINYDGLSN